MAELSWQTIKEMVRDRAKGRCVYCLTAEINMGQALHIEHIRPENGETPDNLCLACPNCNLSKAVATTAVDPHTNTEVPLFSPREQHWTDLFPGRKISAKYLG